MRYLKDELDKIAISGQLSLSELMMYCKKEGLEIPKTKLEDLIKR